MGEKSVHSLPVCDQAMNPGPPWPLRLENSFDISHTSICLVQDDEAGRQLLVVGSGPEGRLVVYDLDTGAEVRTVYWSGTRVSSKRILPQKVCSSAPSHGTVLVTDTWLSVIEVRVRGESDFFVRGIPTGDPQCFVGGVDVDSDVIAILFDQHHFVRLLNWNDCSLRHKVSWQGGHSLRPGICSPMVLTRDGRHVIVGCGVAGALKKVTHDGEVVWTKPYRTRCVAEAPDGDLLLITYDGVLVKLSSSGDEIGQCSEYLASSLAVSKSGQMVLGTHELHTTDRRILLFSSNDLRWAWIAKVVFRK